MKSIVSFQLSRSVVLSALKKSTAIALSIDEVEIQRHWRVTPSVGKWSFESAPAEVADEYARQADATTDHYPRTDLEFHLQIARSTQNPLFCALLNVISRYVIEVQVQSWGSGLPVAWDRAKRADFAILDAIRDRDPDRARVMEAHLRFTATLVKP